MMIGDMIAKARKEKKMTKTELSRLTNINIGHLTHIEKGERNPSHKTLKNICTALNIPYQQLMFTYDKCVNEEQEDYNLIKHISYDKLLAVSNIEGFIDCPSNIPNSSIALKITDNSMFKTLKTDSYVFVEFNSLLSNGDIGLFSFNNEILIRRFLIKNSNIILNADNKQIDDIKISNNDDFYIIGKIFVK